MRKHIARLSRGLSALMAALTLSLCACGAPESAPEESGGKKELRVACQYAYSTLTGLVSAFNAQSQEYRLVIVKYDQPGWTETLLAEAAAGKAPDVFVGSALVGEAVDSGVCLDLMPRLRQSGLESTLLPGLWNAMESQGQVYWMPCDMTVDTYTARASAIGEISELTMERAEALAAELDIGVFPSWFTREDMLSRVIMFSMGQFVDEGAKTCFFDRGDFAALLEACAAAPESLPEDVDLDAPCLLWPFPLQTVSLARNLKARYGGDYCYAGFPTEAGGVSQLSFGLELGIYSLSEDLDGAWEFIAFALSEESQSETEFLPVTLPALEAMVSQELRDGKTYLDAGLPAFEQEDADKLMDLVCGTDAVYFGRETVRDIIMEEAQTFFAGQCTAERSGERVQSRVSLYLAERG